MAAVLADEPLAQEDGGLDLAGVARDGGDGEQVRTQQVNARQLGERRGDRLGVARRARVRPELEEDSREAQGKGGQVGHW